MFSTIVSPRFKRFSISFVETLCEKKKRYLVTTVDTFVLFYNLLLIKKRTHIDKLYTYIFNLTFFNLNKLINIFVHYMIRLRMFLK